jgi:hypothetical protein
MRRVPGFRHPLKATAPRYGVPSAKICLAVYEKYAKTKREIFG